MSYTPGPWGISERDHVVFGLDTITDRHLIAEVYGETPQNKWDNTRLIAAAPEMLDACKAISLLADGQGRLNMLEVAGMARAAIAKAERKENV